MKILPQLLLVQKTLINVEGLSRYLYPDINLFKIAKENVQVWKAFENGEGLWLNVLCTKGKRFYSIDKSFLLNLTVSNMHNAWKKMVDYDLWKRMGTKTHADYPYKMNNVATEEVAA